MLSILIIHSSTNLSDQILVSFSSHGASSAVNLKFWVGCSIIEAEAERTALNVMIICIEDSV